MAVAFRAQAHATFATSVNTTVNKPTGTADDDILFAAFYFPTALSVTAPSGWTEYTGSPFTGGVTGLVMRTYWKRATSEGASWTWTHISAISAGVVAAYSGAITSGDPNDCTPTNNSQAVADKNVIALSITTATANSLGIIYWIPSATTGSITLPGTFAERGDPADYGGLDDQTIAASGATGNQTIVLGNNNQWGTFFTAFKIAATGRTTKNTRNNPLGIEIGMGWQMDV